MRDQQPDRWRPRNLGAVDSRISSSVRKLSYTPDIPLQAGTPVIWLDPEVVAMTTPGTATEQNNLTDRAGVLWEEVTLGGGGGGRSIWQMANGLNSRNCWLSDGPYDTDSQAGVSTFGTNASVTIGADFTVFVVLKMNSFNASNPGAVNIFMRQQVSIADPTPNFSMSFQADTTYFFSRVSAGGVTTAAVGNMFAPHVITAQSTSTRNEIWLDGTVGSNANPGTSVTNPRKLYIGSSKPDEPLAWYTRAFYGDVIIYNSILSSANRNAVEKYLGRKYGITVA